MQPSVSPLHDAKKKVGELDHFGSLHRVVEPNGAMAGRILVGADCSCEQVGDSLLFSALCPDLRERIGILQ